ncbi:MAG: proline--tRNA ligase [Bdellovibrionales bacterium]
MKWTKNFVFTTREAPADAEIISHQLLVRAGYIKKLAPGIFTLQNLGLRVLRKIEKIIREELDKRNCTEILMPMVQPQELWAETNRLNIDVLLKFKNRNGHLFCLGATHEEVVTDIVRSDVRSYRDLPKNLYQIQTKYRDEIRPRFGLMRGREFIMKDAYSFDADVPSAHKSYEIMREAYIAIFARLGLDYRIVEADAGNIGGNMTHEFQVLAESGEDKIVFCNACDFAANIEVAHCGEEPAPTSGAPQALETFDTPNLRTIEDLSQSLKVPAKNLVKTLFYQGVKGPVALLLRGDDEANPVKVKKALGLDSDPLFLTEEEIVKATGGAHPGSCGPVGLKIPIYMDLALKDYVNFVVGANVDDKHLRNVNRGRDFKETALVDLRMAQEGDRCLKCDKGSYRITRGIEVGHIFYLGTKYSKAMKANYLNVQGKAMPIEMGCYGIGVTRTLQAGVEQNHDKDGIVWPLPIAPYHVHICLLDPSDNKCSEISEQIYKQLWDSGIEVFVDDREERPGIKFKDADLLGVPLRLNIGKRGVDNNQIDVIIRKTKESTALAPDQVVSFVQNHIRQNMPPC